MNSTHTSAALITLLACSCVSVQADTLIGLGRTNSPHYIIQIPPSGNSNGWRDADGINVKDAGTNSEFRLFCSDLYTKTSDAFGGNGQEYKTSALNDSPFHNQKQKDYLQSLFDRVYTKAFNADYSVNNVLYAEIFQIAVWEIIHDSSTGLSTDAGNIIVKSAATLDTDGKHYIDNDAAVLIRNTLNSWYDAIVNDTWDLLGYVSDSVNLTVYLAEGGADVSQTFIGVAPEGSATPEPATILMFGMGAVGMGIVKICRNKK